MLPTPLPFLLLGLLGLALRGLRSVTASPNPAPPLDAARSTIPILGPILDDLGNGPPPAILQTTTPSPECADINQGELMCCRATLAGDVQLVVWLASVVGYQLNPNDVNGVDCDGNLTACPGTEMCCQVTALTPLLALYCADYK